MKKKIIIAMAALSIFAAQTQKANAGMTIAVSAMVGATAVACFSENIDALHVLAITSLTSWAVGMVGAFTGNDILFILNADGSLEQSSLERVISNKYSTIEDKNVVSALASEIKARADREEFVDSKKMVSVDEETVRSILDQADVSEETVQKIVADLK